MRRRLLIAVSVLLAVPLVLGAAGWLLLVSPLGESMVTGRIVRALSASLGGDVRLDELELSPLRGSATVRGLSVRDGRATVETLDVSSAVVRVSLFELLRRRVRVTAVDAERVVVRLRSGIEREDEPRDLDLTPVSLLSAVRVADGELVVENEQIPFAVDVKGIRILGAPSGPGRPGCRGRVQAGPIALSLADLPRQHLERATARFSWAPPRIRVPEFAVDGPSGQVTGSLTVGLTRSGFVVNGGASGVLRAERVLPPRIPEVSGALQVWSSFHAAVPGDWEVQADISDVEGLASLDILWRDVRGHVELGSGHTVLSGLRGTTAGGSQIDGVTLHVEGDDWSVEGSGRLRIPELLERASLDRTLARGTASVELAAAGSTTGGVYRWTTEGRVDAEAPRTAALAGEFSGRGGPEGSAFEYAGGWGGGALAAKVAWDEPIPRGAWRASGKLSAATGEAARPLLARIVGQAAEKGLVLPDAVIPDPAGGLDLTATVSGDDATLDVARVTGEIRDPVTAGASHERLEIGIDWSRRGDWRASGRLADRLGRGVRAEAERARHGDVAFAVHVDELPIAVIPEILDVP
ncbi:MAG: hypothetical protein OEQ13_10370, partial [Acidobacteriota bacterium]|nr:hypothetical protein [Acidobacteriota bacterium]